MLAERGTYEPSQCGLRGLFSEIFGHVAWRVQEAKKGISFRSTLVRVPLAWPVIPHTCSVPA